METKVNYAVVGLFVLVLGAALIGGVLWLSSARQFGEEYDRYLAYMNESVSGLNLNAPVKYRGVEIGWVRRISLDPANPERVRLELEIARGTPIKTDTLAVLRTQGLTGIAYLELDGGSRDAPPLRAKPGNKYPVIPTGPSLMTRLDTAVTHLIASLTQTSENLNALLDKNNRRALSQTLDNLNTLSTALSAHRGDIGRTLANAARISAALPRLIARANQSADALRAMAAETSRTNVTARAALNDLRGGAQRFSRQSLPRLDQALEETRAAAAALRQLSEQLERQPGTLLRGKQPPPPGPGE